jgi:spore germination protein KC
VLLIGAALAEEGVRDRMDIFMRNQETRLEVPVIITEGRAEEVLSAKLDQEKVSGVLLSRVIQNLSAVSPCYKVRILDFASMLKSKTADPAIPLISVARTGDKNEIQVDGMAVFKGDKMVGRLGNDDVPGYEWAMGNVEQCGIAVYDGERKAVFHVLRIDGKRKVTLRQDGGARVDIAVEATLNISELSDFGGVSPEELMPYLKQAAREKIKNSVVRAFALTQDLNTDIYGISAAARRRYPRQWKRMGERREALFSECEVNVSVKADIHETGQITKSLEMGEGTDEN